MHNHWVNVVFPYLFWFLKAFNLWCLFLTEVSWDQVLWEFIQQWTGQWPFLDLNPWFSEPQYCWNLGPSSFGLFYHMSGLVTRTSSIPSSSSNRHDQHLLGGKLPTVDGFLDGLGTRLGFSGINWNSFGKQSYPAIFIYLGSWLEQSKGR